MNAFAAVVALVLAAGSSAGAQLPAEQAPERTAPSRAVSAESAPALVWVISPWGYGAWYNVCPGRNLLRCVGTGCWFNYWY